MSEDVELRRHGYYSFDAEGRLDGAVSAEAVDSKFLAELETHWYVLIHVKSIITPYKALATNYDRLLEGIRAIISDYEKGQGLVRTKLERSLEDMTEVARLVANFLASCRSFLDQTSHALSAKHGEQSAERTAFLALTSRHFDEEFAYRFASKLRNYSQHFGLPLSSLRVSGSATPDGFEFKALVAIKGASLLEERFDWGARLRQEIAEQDAEFDLMPLLASYMDAMKSLCRHVIAARSKDLFVAASYLNAVLTAWAVPEGAVPVIWVGENQAQNTPPNRMEILPVAELDFIRSILASVWPTPENAIGTAE